MSINLRDALLAGLARLPGTREFHIHVLVSSPRKHATLFAFARPRPRAYLQDILVLLSEQATPDAARILVTAVEACVYNIPSTSSAVFYVSKVDSTGQSAYPSPTMTVVRSLLTFYSDPATRPLAVDNIWIHVFARAQAQYLFPNSAEYSGKRPLSDVRLCGWWKCVLSEVAEELKARLQPAAVVKLYYVLPGYSEFEAKHTLSSSGDRQTARSDCWLYGHPYSQSEIPLPCPPDKVSDGRPNLGHLIPYFDDDPKSRFLDEIAYTPDGDGIKSPARKRSRTVSENCHAEAANDRPPGELGKVSPDEFWERMSFRQECVAGAVTGYFTVGICTPGHHTESSMSPLVPQAGHVSSQINKRIMTSLLTSVEFSTIERAIHATELLEGSIKGLCEGHTLVDDRREVSQRPRLRVIADVSPVTSIYHSDIYGTVCVSNSVTTVARTAPHVTVLTVRKKKKRTG